MPRSDYPRRAVITGIGPITPVGTGVDAFWHGLLREQGAVARLTRFDTAPFHAKSAAEVSDFDPATYFTPHRLKRLDRYSQLAVASARLAIEDSGLELSPDSPRARAGVSFGTALGGIANAESEHTKFLQRGPKGVTRALALQVFGGAAHSNIAIDYGLQGPGTTNSNSCASANVALGDALTWIRTGRAEVVIAGAAEAPLAPLTYCAFDNIHTMSRFTGEPAGHACRPFDRARSGFVMGEGAASFVMEDLNHARERGARVYGEVLGFSQNNEAYHMTTPHPSGAPLRAAMRLALDDAEIDPAAIDYINAHASATQLNDINELQSISQVFGARASEIPISGTKAYTGHPLGATGGMEIAACLLAIRNGWIPPTLHLEQPDESFRHFDLVPRHGREVEITTVLTNAFGFGGINSCLVLRAFR
ncbi:beta-ketoacyl-ACP synthase II [soil metagenome]